MRKLFKRLIAQDTGAEILEYVLIAGLVIISAVAIVAVFGTKVLARWTSLNTLIPS